MPAVSPGHRMLVVDDDEVFRTVLARALARRGFDVRSAADVPQAIAMLDGFVPEYAVVDLRMPGPSGLELIAALHARRATMRIVVLTGYASVATAVEAIKLGATHYLAKPADADQVIAALGMTDGDAAVPVGPQPMSVDRLEWEHIQKVLAEQGGNVSATARLLNMHRRTLQRKLAKHPTRQ